jgi:diguanylate cyclase (GGDEF)-like protein
MGLVLFVLVVGVVNLALGYSLALVLAGCAGFAGRPRAARQHLEETAAEDAAHVEAAPAEALAPSSAEPMEPVSLPVEALSPEWFELFGDAAPSKPLADAVQPMMRLDMGRYREQLLRFDTHLRSLEELDTAVLAITCSDLKTASEEWLQRQRDAARSLESRREGLEHSDEATASLERALSDSSNQIEEACGKLQQLDLSADPAAGRGRLLEEIARLVDLCHTVRDQVFEAMLGLMQGDGRLAYLANRLQVDQQTELCNRAGLAVALEEWRNSDRGSQPACVAVLDIAGVAQVNRQYGPALGDRLIRRIGQLVRDLFPQPAESHMLARFSGQQLLIFVRGAGPQGAIHDIEKARQAIGGTAFLHGETPLEICATCGLAALTADDVPGGLTRALSALQAAKQSGGNQTFLHESSGPSPVPPPQLHVPASVVQLESDAA